MVSCKEIVVFDRNMEFELPAWLAMALIIALLVLSKSVQTHNREKYKKQLEEERAKKKLEAKTN